MSIQIKASEFVEELKAMVRPVSQNGFQTNFEPLLDVGGFYLSIQGSAFHYAEPRENLNILGEFTLVECAAFRLDDPEDLGMLDVQKHADLKPYAEDFKAMGWWDEGTVMPYASWENVQQLIELLLHILPR